MIISENKEILGLCSKNGINALNLPRHQNLLFNVIKEGFLKIGINDQAFFNMPSEIEPDENIIVFDARVSQFYLRLLKRLFPDNRIIFWYWNDVRYTLNPALVPDGIEKWSYSEQDCKKYNMKYNNQFVLYESMDTSSEEYVYDVFYVGRDKNRFTDLIRFEQVLKKKNIKTYFHIVANRNHFVFKNKKYYKPSISYDAIVSLIKQSKTIFDYYEDPYMGLSLRPLEALLYQKKLITNNRNIINYNFYNKDNIYVIGIDDINEIDQFIKMPYINNKHQISNYSFRAWLSSFDNI